MTNPETSRCPRCRYDLRGVSAQWRNSCPLDGSCAECGLTFRWRDIFHPQFTVPRWYYEHRQAGAIPMIRLLRTAVRALLPFHFWSRVPIHAPLHRSRVIAASVVSLLAILLALLIGQGTVVAVDVLSKNQGLLTRSPAGAVAHAVILPLSNEPVAELQYSLVGPASNPMLWVSQLPSPRGYLKETWDGLWMLLATFVFAPLAAGLTYAALPVSRRLAKVRAHHIVRIVVALYGLVTPAVLLVVAAACANQTSFGSTVAVWLSVGSLVAAGVLLPFTLVWWWAASRNYLQMPHAPAVALSVWLIGWFAPFAFGSLAWTLS